MCIYCTKNRKLIIYDSVLNFNNAQYKYELVIVNTFLRREKSIIEPRKVEETNHILIILYGRQKI